MEPVELAEPKVPAIQSNKRASFQMKSGLGLLILLICLLVAFSLLSPYFLSVSNFMNIGLADATMGIMAIFTTMIIISGQIDLSIASVLALTGVVSAYVLQSTGSAFLAVLAGLAVGLIFGAINGFLVVYLKINSLISTLGTMSIAGGFAYIFTNGVTAVFSSPSLNQLGQGVILGIPVPLIIMLLLFVFAYIFLNRTLAGRTIYFIGGNIEASRLAGIPTKAYYMFLFIFSGLASSLAGLIISAQLGAAAPQAATGMELSVIAAVILGGCSLAGGKGSIIGTFLGIVILGTLNNGLVLLNVSSYYQEVARGVILLLAVGLDQLRKTD